MGGDRTVMRRLPLIALGTALACLLVANAVAPAALSAGQAPSLLWTAGENCGDNGKAGNGECGAAGETVLPRGIATDPVTGHVYVADLVNNRISEFTAWGVFAKAWGWGVANGAPELQSCGPEANPPTATCRAGKSGSGAGDLSRPHGVAVDSFGDVYVAETDNLRVQKFDREGHFLLMFGGEVDQGVHHPGDVCTAAYVAEGDTCGAGVKGTADGEFSEWPFSSFIAVGPADQVYVGDRNRIQEFDTSGVYVSQMPLPKEGEVGSLAVDPENGNVYFAYPNTGSEIEKAVPNVYKLSPTTGEVLGTLEVSIPMALATDAHGDIYVFDDHMPKGHEARILEFDSSGKQTAVFAENELNESTAIATNTVTAAGGVDIYASNPTEDRSFIHAYGSPPDKWLPPAAAPTISSQYAISVNSADALLGAQIDPRFWADTSYYVQYGKAPCAEGGCTDRPLAPGSELGGGVTEADVATPGVFVSGLEPGTTYHYRFVAQSSGGGPVLGSDHTFTTPSLPVNDVACVNQVLRTGASVFLPDCRAYELASPIDKEGGDIISFNGANDPARLDQSSVDGNGLAYTSYRPFGGAQSAPLSSQYLASRGANGWATRAISPPQEGDQFLTYLQLNKLFKAFSPDLSTAWNLTNTEPVIGPGGQTGIPNLYRRENTSSVYEACTTAKPLQPEREGPELQGVSSDQSHAIFRDNNKLTGEANTGTNNQLYECSFQAGEPATVRLVSFLPDGTPTKLDATAGTQYHGPKSGDQGFRANLTGAVSGDGSRVFWTENTDIAAYGGPGTIYVRVNATEPASPVSGGKCTKVIRACTYSVSGSVTGENARFWAAARDGSTALFTVEVGLLAGNLYTFDVERREPHLISKQTLGVLGSSEDLSHVYFLSKEQIAGEGVAGQPNLYLYEAGESGPVYTFIATLSQDDGHAGVELRSPINESPDNHTARVSPDGAHLAFMSNDAALAESVAGYDNTDLTSGQPDAEVYRYDAGSGRLACVSCNPTGARPSGRELPGVFEKTAVVWAAAQIPGWESSLYAQRVLADDGTRLFFESFEGLVPADTNGRTDVYEWEQAGAGDCKEGDSSYVKASGGCLSLTSSGKSPSDSEFIDASPDGSNVFFTTAASLVPQDPGQIDVYDARVNGGFPPQALPPAACEGEACQAPTAPPNDVTPASALFDGPGGLVPALTTSVSPKNKTATQTRARQLARALKACRAKAKRRRKRCEATARARYGGKAKGAAKKSDRGGK